MKSSFLVFLGDEKGGAGCRVFASNIDEVRAVFNLPEPGCQIYPEEDAPYWLKSPHLLESDIHIQEPWLQELAYRKYKRYL